MLDGRQYPVGSTAFMETHCRGMSSTSQSRQVWRTWGFRVEREMSWCLWWAVLPIFLCENMQVSQLWKQVDLESSGTGKFYLCVGMMCVE